jgi:hypothetical protein
MDMFSVGIIDQPTAVRMLEVGGVQKIMDTMNVAERKAQRENIKMKMLTPDDVEMVRQQAMQEIMTQLPPEAMQNRADYAGDSKHACAPIITVDNFDIHEVHIETHNKFRMSQEYEILPDELKAQFAEHVAQHEQAIQQKQCMASNDESGGPPMGGGHGCSYRWPSNGPRCYDGS